MAQPGTSVRMPLATHRQFQESGWGTYPWRFCGGEAVVVVAPTEEIAEELRVWAIMAGTGAVYRF